MGSSSYWIDLRHEGLKTYRRISGRDRYVVEQKAAAQTAAWNEKWAKIQSRETTLHSKWAKKDYAARQTKDATDALQNLEDTLLLSLTRKSTIDWETLKDFSPYAKPKPSPPAKRDYPISPSPTDTKYDISFNVFDYLLPSLRKKKTDAARIAFEQDLSEWLEVKAKIDEQITSEQSHYEQTLQLWNADKAAFEEAQRAGNASVDQTHSLYLELSAEAITDYCDLVLGNSVYPDAFPRSWRFDYNPMTRLLLVDYSLPNIASIPRLKEIKYIATRDMVSEVNLADSAVEKIYDGLIYKIVLRTIHELFDADVVDGISSIIFNGWVNSIDKATGQESNGCIVSVQVDKSEFLMINLNQVDPKACFKKLKGVGSSKLAALVPIRPILQLDMQDDRFVASNEVASSLDDSINLAAMDWEDFEHLIRQLFEKEFNTDGSVVSITRASRDAGVDAVVFDPDPLRGGKIVIQAKRYTNTVGVSAVRDLYGTVMNEGANKGILVTTADYGPDSYEFAKDKPLTLLSGSNLLHLLAKHGHRAKIDLREAKQLLQGEINQK